MNNKGFTIIELLVSIALISVVMVFMMELLFDLQYEQSDNFIAVSNQETRFEIIDFAEKKIFKTDGIKNIQNKNGELLIKDSSNNVIYKIKITNTNFSFLQNDLVLRQWDINNATMDTNIICNDNIAGSYYGVLCKIKVYTENINNSSLNNNILDDIEISFKYKEDKYQLQIG